MSGLPPLGLVRATRERTDLHSFEEWCFCQRCMRVQKMRAVGHGVLVLLCLIAIYCVWRYLP